MICITKCEKKFVHRLGGGGHGPLWPPPGSATAPARNRVGKLSQLPPSNSRNLIDYPSSKSGRKTLSTTPPARIHGTSSTTPPPRNRVGKLSQLPPLSNSRNLIDYPPSKSGRKTLSTTPPRIHGTSSTTPPRNRVGTEIVPPNSIPRSATGALASGFGLRPQFPKNFEFRQAVFYT